MSLYSPTHGELSLDRLFPRLRRAQAKDRSLGEGPADPTAETPVETDNDKLRLTATPRLPLQSPAAQKVPMTPFATPCYSDTGYSVCGKELPGSPSPVKGKHLHRISITRHAADAMTPPPSLSASPQTVYPRLSYGIPGRAPPWTQLRSEAVTVGQVQGLLDILRRGGEVPPLALPPPTVGLNSPFGGSVAPTEPEPTSSARRQERIRNCLLERFQEHCNSLWAEMPEEDKVPVTLRLLRGHAKVRCLPPIKKIPTMWSPLNCLRFRAFAKSKWKYVLYDLDCDFPAGQMTLVMGAPGSGKTALLKLLGGQLQKDRAHWQAQGLYYNGVAADKSPLNSGLCFSFVPESDLHHIPTMTVRDTLKFAYQCKARYGGKDSSHVAHILEALGLSHVAKSIVGNDLVRGVSGGERRRVTIGEMWVSDVKVLLADHLTDGLDSATTCDIISALKIWCRTLRTTVVMTVQQPPPEVYRCFDKVVVMEEGTVAFAGSLMDAARFFGQLGYDQPIATAPTATPAASILSRAATIRAGAHLQASLPYSSPFSCRLPPRETDPEKPVPADVEAGGDGEEANQRLQRLMRKKYARPWHVHLGLCLKRQFFLEHTNYGLMVGRVLINLCTGLLTGSLWAHLPHSCEGLLLVTSLVFHCCMSVVLSVAMDMAPMFNERAVFYKQRDSFFYGTVPYWIANNFFRVFLWGFIESGLFCAPIYWISGLVGTASEFLFFWLMLYLLNVIASVMFKSIVVLCPTLAVAQTTVGLLQVFFFLFSGYLIPWNRLPSGWLWARWLSAQSYAFGALTTGQLKGQTYSTPVTLLGYPCNILGNTYLSFQDITVLGHGAYAGLLGMWMLVWFLVGMVLLMVVRHRVRHPAAFVAPAEDPDDDRPLHFLQPAPMVLTWEKLSYTITVRKFPCWGKKQEKVLLNGISGYAKPGTLTALMGPSGAGKTTLLDVLAGRKTAGKIDGEILVNGQLKKTTDFARYTGYVQQMDQHIQKCTVYESLKFSGNLRLPESVPKAEKKALLRTLLSVLELRAIAHERVKDITVEQRKRLSIGVELMSNPSILFLDEPTTGLDAKGAQQVMLVVLNLCRELGVAAVCTIHQPSTDLFSIFDYLLLLHYSGKQIYFGPVGPGAECVKEYFEAIPGIHPLRPGMNPATWMLEEIGGGVSHNRERGDLLAATFEGHRLRLEMEAEIRSTSCGSLSSRSYGLEKHEDAASASVGYPSCSPPPRARSSPYATSYGTQLWFVLRRCLDVYWRSPSYNLIRICIIAVLAAIFGTAYWRLSWDQQDIFLRLSWAYTTSYYLGLTFIVAGLSVHINERGVFNREQASRTYAPWVYGLCYQIAELPYVTIITMVFLAIAWFLSDINGGLTGPSTPVLYFKTLFPLWLFTMMCTFLGQMIARLSPTVEVANAIGTGVASWFSSFAGFYLPKPYIPGGYIWLYWLNPFKWTYEAIVVGLFEDRTLSCSLTGFEARPDSVIYGCASGNTVISFLGMQPTLWWLDHVVVAGYTLGFIGAGLLLVQFLRFDNK